MGRHTAFVDNTTVKSVFDRAVCGLEYRHKYKHTFRTQQQWTYKYLYLTNIFSSFQFVNKPLEEDRAKYKDFILVPVYTREIYVVTRRSKFTGRKNDLNDYEANVKMAN